MSDGNKKGWFIAQLSYAGEQQADSLVAKEIKDKIGDCDIFFPSYKEEVDGFLINKTLIPGYVFIRMCEKISDPFQLETSNFIERIITTYNSDKGRRVKIVSDSYIDSIKDKLLCEIKNTNIKEGQDIFISSGLYENLTGKIVKIIDKTSKVLVRIELSSRVLLVEVPQSCLSEI